MLEFGSKANGDRDRTTLVYRPQSESPVRCGERGRRFAYCFTNYIYLLIFLFSDVVLILFFFLPRYVRAAIVDIGIYRSYTVRLRPWHTQDRILIFERKRYCGERQSRIWSEVLIYGWTSKVDEIEEGRDGDLLLLWDAIYLMQKTCSRTGDFKSRR